MYECVALWSIPVLQSQALSLLSRAPLTQVHGCLLIGQPLVSECANRKRKRQEPFSVWSPSNITLGGMDAKLRQLRQLRQHMLRHCDVNPHSQWQIWFVAGSLREYAISFNVRVYL